MTGDFLDESGSVAYGDAGLGPLERRPYLPRRFPSVVAAKPGTSRCWDRQAAVMGSEIQGRTLGIVGLGHSGRELARLVGPFAMRILAFSPHADSAVAQDLGVRLTSLEEVLRESDFVSLHCRLTDAT